MPSFKSAVSGRFITAKRALRRPRQSYELTRRRLITPGQVADLKRALHEYNELLDARGALSADADGLSAAAIMFAEEWVRAERWV